MGSLVWIGTALSVLGLAGLVLCIVTAYRAKRAGLDDAAMRSRLKQLVVWNLAALMVSSLGLVVVIAGLFLR